jgi:hypothetical protein
MKTTWILEHDGKTATITTEDPENHTAHMAWKNGQRMFAGAPAFPFVKVTRLPREATDILSPEVIARNSKKALEKLRGKPRT